MVTLLKKWQINGKTSFPKPHLFTYSTLLQKITSLSVGKKTTLSKATSASSKSIKGITQSLIINAIDATLFRTDWRVIMQDTTHPAYDPP